MAGGFPICRTCGASSWWFSTVVCIAWGAFDLACASIGRRRPRPQRRSRDFRRGLFGLGPGLGAEEIRMGASGTGLGSGSGGSGFGVGPSCASLTMQMPASGTGSQTAGTNLVVPAPGTSAKTSAMAPMMPICSATSPRWLNRKARGQTHFPLHISRASLLLT